jgi:gliding motility-associated-like protein
MQALRVNIVKFLILFIFTIVSSRISAQIMVDETLTPEEIVQNVLLGSGVAVFNITFNGQPGDQLNNQIGKFSGTSAVVDFPVGVVMGSGQVASIVDINLNDPPTVPIQNDPDLMAISNQSINNAAVLEFDFIPNGDSLEFRYVFASREYPGFTCSGFNDAFGFFISGPGFNGPFTNDAVNIALVPGTDIPVAINTINEGLLENNATCLAANPNYIEDSQYFVPNDPPLPDDINVPGMTVTLTAYALVTCGETYHIKLAIGDALDTALDSFVFLEAESFNSNSAVQVNLDIPIGVNDSTLYEGCGQAVLDFIRPLTSTGVDEVAYLDITGSAINGVDFIPPLPDSILFSAGIDTVSFVLTAPADGIFEGQEYVQVVITNIASGCGGQQVTSDFIFYVNEADPLQISGFDGALEDCNDDIQLFPTVTGGYGEYQYAWTNGATADSITVSPGFTTTYFVVVSDTCGAGSQQTSFEVEVPVYPPIEVDLGEDLIVEECDVTVTLVPEVSGGFGAYAYQWVHQGLVIGTTPTLDFFVENSSTITLTVSDDCQATGVDMIDIVLPPVEVTAFLPDIFSASSCLEEIMLPVVSDGGIGQKTYRWFVDGELIEQGTNLFFMYHPSMGQNVVMQAEDECQNMASDSTVIAFNFPEVTLETTPDTSICKNTGAELFARVRGGSGGFKYEWPTINKTDTVVEVFPRQNSVYPVNVTDTCSMRAEETIRVDVRVVFADFEWDNLDYYGLQLRNRSLPLENSTFAWDFGDGATSTELDPRHFFDEIDPFTVQLITMDEAGCTDTTSRVTQPPIEIFIPTAFTPNGDGVNDMFVIHGPNITEFSMKIFDRFGALVFETDDILRRWNGSHNGGDYFPTASLYNYIIRFKGEREEDAIVRTGTISVIR